MRKYKVGENVTVVLPDKREVTGVIKKVSPDRRNLTVRIDDNTDILTEPQFLKGRGQKEKRSWDTPSRPITPTPKR